MSPKVNKPNPFTKARRAGVPIVAIETADPAATITKCQLSLNGKGEITPLLTWDIVRGLSAINRPGAQVLSHFSDDLPLQDPCACLATLVSKADKLSVLPEGADRSVAAIVFMIHFNRFIDGTDSMQAVWNARLAFEPIGATLVLLGPTMKLPVELKNDVVLISEPLPDHAELGDILDKITSDAELKPEAVGDRDRVIDIMSGTSAFGSRQILAMSVTKEGVDQEQLWDRKRKMIEQCPGLSVWRDGSSFDEIGGLSNLKTRLSKLLQSEVSPVRCVVFIDEIEKALAGGTEGAMDGGVSKDQVSVILRVMQDYNLPGVILVGHAGTGKSNIAKAAGNIAKCPTIAFDLGSMKDSLVGASEARIRSAMDVVRAVSDDRAFFIATCNKISSLPPELRRRFKLGTFFVDLPTPEEQAKIWSIWIKKFDLKAKQALPDCDGWTGAEIAACCESAWRTGETLKEAALCIVPVIKSAPEAVESLRKLASNRFIDASKPGVFVYNAGDVKQAASGRKIEL